MPYHHWQATYKYPRLLNFHVAEIYTDQLLFKHCISQTMMIGSCYSVFHFLFPLAKSYPATMLSRSCNYFTKEILEYVSLKAMLCQCACCLASNPGFPFRILSHSFEEKTIFLQSCETKSGTESLGTRLHVVMFQILLASFPGSPTLEREYTWRAWYHVSMI